MAYIANTAFEARVTNNEFNTLVNIAGKYQASSADADCSAGLLCKRVSLLPCEGFTGVNNENTWLMNAGAGSDAVLYACNTYETKKIGGYHIGTETLGLGVEAGRYGTFTAIVFDGQHKYRFGIGNVNGSISTNKYFTIASGMLVPASAAPTGAGTKYFELTEQGNFIEGTSVSFGYVDVIAHKVGE